MQLKAADEGALAALLPLLVKVRVRARVRVRFGFGDG